MTLTCPVQHQLKCPAESDFPVVKFSSTYKQAFEVFNKYCDFMSENDKNLIQGNNLLKLIKERGKID